MEMKKMMTMKNLSLTEFTDSTEVIKMEEDFSELCEKKLPELKLKAKTNFQLAIDDLLKFEKITRTSGDVMSTTKILVTIIHICFEHQKWDQLNEIVVMLIKRRAQMKHSIVAMVKECLNHVEVIKDEEQRIRFLNTLHTQTNGKIYVEVEHAHVTKLLSEHKEATGDLVEACRLMEELHIETFGSMDRKEKIEFMLEQMRLFLVTKDMTKAKIFSKKINSKFFEDAQEQALKFKYYGQMIQLEQETNYINTSRHYQAVINTEVVFNTASRRQRMLTCAIFYCILAPYDNDQYQMMLTLLKNPIITEIPMYKIFLELFIKNELINWSSLCQTYTKDLLTFSTFDSKKTYGIQCWKELRSRVVEHNMRIISMYYSRIRYDRLAELVGLEINECEEILERLITDKTIKAKIDRPLTIVQFIHGSTQTADKLNDWSMQIKELMDLVHHATHLIHKNEMVNYIN